MSVSQEISNSVSRFRVYADELGRLLQTHEIRSVRGLVAAVRGNEAFMAEWRAIWTGIARADGGKISLATAGSILGTSLGGVGIAAMGGAFGVPLALVLGLGGFIVGIEFDAVRAQSAHRLQVLRIPRALFDRLEGAARAGGVPPRELIVNVLAEAFPENPELTE